MIRKIFVAAIGCIVLFSACKKQETRELSEIEDTLIQDFLAKNQLTKLFKKSESGYYYQIIDEGNGSLEQLKNKDQITFFHRTTSINKNVDYSSSEFYPAVDYLGYVKPNTWREVMLKVKKGAVIRVITPSHLAYGKEGAEPTIPSNAILDTRLVIADDSDRDVYEDNLINKFLTQHNIPAIKDSGLGIYYQIIEEGNGKTPQLSSDVRVAYTGKHLSGTVFETVSNSSPYRLTLSNLIKGWQYGLPKIKEGGKIRLIIPSKLAYGAKQSGSIRPNTVLDFEIELIAVID